MGEGLAIQSSYALDGIMNAQSTWDCFGDQVSGDPVPASNNGGVVFSIQDSHSNKITLGDEMKKAIHSEIRDFLKQNIEVEVFRWKDEDGTVTAQVFLDGDLITENTFQLK